MQDCGGIAEKHGGARRITKMSIDKEASRVWRGRIREILNSEWDPIGGCPEDEYDSYVGTLTAMIREKASDDDLLQYLKWVESDYIGLGTFDAERARKVIASLRRLGIP